MAAEDVLQSLLDQLWKRYCTRVAYARRYCELVAAQGGRVVNDHIAFRTLNTRTGRQPAGIKAISRVFEPLGYTRMDRYDFTDKHLLAYHYEHPDPLMPKIFISQLEVDRLPAESRILIDAAVADARDALSEDGRAMLEQIDKLNPADEVVLVDRLLGCLTARPWSPPRREVILQVNQVSQYAAWTLLHGNNVNHFTAYINEQNIPAWPDLEATMNGLRAQGLPIKEDIEGQPGSKLRQSATQAVDEDCEVLEADGRVGKLRWAYAYYELAERGTVPGPDGRPRRFNGFLGAQATQLFEMTRR